MLWWRHQEGKYTYYCNRGCSRGRDGLHRPPPAQIRARPGPRSDTRWWFIPALLEAKIRDYTWHNNLHTFCSWLAMAGVSTKEIQVLAGHKTITMAARYAHLSPEATASASERLVMP